SLISWLLTWREDSTLMSVTPCSAAAARSEGSVMMDLLGRKHHSGTKAHLKYLAVRIWLRNERISEMIQQEIENILKEYNITVKRPLDLLQKAEER
ncbi:MAG: hypothetical protein HW374_230, partial [Bacteroidetes bacterium]|nr:hypothetical protein [Bacteroidota bacterium]